MPDFISLLTPEEKLLLSLCRLGFSDSEKEKIRELVRQVEDWVEFIRLANEHGIIALAWYNLVDTGNKDLLPVAFLDRLYAGYMKSLARNTAIFDLLNEVIEIAAKENIRIVLLKGLALEKTVYGNKGLRQMNDLDILVRREDAVRLRKLLIENGFESPPIISPLHEKILPYYGKHLPEMYKKGFSVEIHFKLFDPPEEILTKKIIDTAVSSANPAYSIPNPQLNFVYLIKHLSRHEAGFKSQLRLYVDLVLMIKKYDSEVLNKDLSGLSRSIGVEKPLANMLHLLKEAFQLKISFVESDIFASDKVNVDEYFLRFMRAPKNENATRESESLLEPLKGIKRPLDKLLFLTGYIFPSINFMKYRYSAKTALNSFLFYPVRWLRLLGLIISGRL